MSVTDFIHDLSRAALPPEVVRQAQRCLLDLTGVAAAGSTTQLSAIIRDHVVRHFASTGTGSRVLFDGRSASPAGAALAGGMTIDAIDAHDGHRLTKGHAGCGVLPALVAFMQAENTCSGGDAELLTGLVLGYEIGTRAGIALHRTAPDYHTSGAWVALACAALGARTLGLDQTATRHALGIAEYHGPRSQMMRGIDHPTMLKDGSGWGAMAGISAGYLAADGFTGAPALTVEGADVDDLWSDLGERWHILDQYFKPYPVCRWGQPAVEAALALVQAHGITHDRVLRIEVVTFHEACRLSTTHPADTEQAQYSLPWPVAAAVVRGDVGVAEISGGAFDDADIARLSESMVLTRSQDYDDEFPARRIAQLTLVLNDGTRLESLPTEAAGEPENPLSDEDLQAKFDRLATPVLGPSRARDLAQSIASMADSESAAEATKGYVRLLTSSLPADMQRQRRSI